MGIFISVIIMIILVGAEVDLFIPSFPELQKVFNLTPFMVELTLGINLAANCISCLFVGTLGDRYGRRPIILYGLGLFVLGSLFCVGAQAYWQLLAGRFLQGMGVAGPAVLAYLVIADAYPPAEQQKKMGTINGCITLAMAFAPTVGSYVNLFFNWRGNFGVLLALGIVCFILAATVLPKGKLNPTVSLSLKEYKPILTSRRAWIYNLSICALCQPFWIFIGMAPILYMGAMKVGLESFGLYQGMMAGVFSVISLSSGYWLKKFGPKRCFNTGLALLLLFIPTTIALMVFKVHDPLIITLVCMLQAAGIIFPINIIWPFSLEAVPNAKGRMSAILVGSRMLVTALSIQLVSAFYHDTFSSIGLAMIIGIGFAFWGIRKLFKEDNFAEKMITRIDEEAEAHEAPLH